MYQLAAYLHLLAAVVWLGGMLFLALVLVPVTRAAQQPPGFSARILSQAARRFRVVSWAALSVLVGTGIWILPERGVALIEVVTGQGWFFTTLRIKLGLVALVLVLSVLHDFVLGPSLARRLEALRSPASNDPLVSQQRKTVSWLARINVGIALAIVALGVVLLRGRPW